MKRIIWPILFAGLFLLLGADQLLAQPVLVDQWGHIGGRRGGAGGANVWKIVTGLPAGSGAIAGDTIPYSQWATIRGGFSPVTANDSEAVVVTGTIEFVGSGPVTWSGLRYGLFRHDSVGTLVDAGTDSARWTGKEADAYGYMFTPQSGTTYIGNIPSGTNASQGVTRGGTWLSTFGGAFGFGGVIQQAPEYAQFSAGTYDWAISVRPLPNGDNEVNFYMIRQGSPAAYWYGGSLIDTSGVTKTFNGVAFGLDPNYVEATSPIREMNLANVQVGLGSRITVPLPPFSPFYVGQWGYLGGRRGGNGGTNYWKVDTAQIVGNAGIHGDAVPKDQWATIRGGFTWPVGATQSKALVITGKIQFVGSGPVTWSGLRYGLFRHDSVGTLIDAGTDTARWSGKESNAYGYMFTPQSGTTYVGNIPSGTNASQGVTRGGSWISTFGGAIGFGGLIQQAPARALFDAGTYDWAISVQPLANGDNEVRFYMVKQGSPTTYWYGGVLTDTTGVSAEYNGVAFGLDNNYDEATSPIRAMKLIDVYVNMVDAATPLQIPKKPWQDYYVDQWGFASTNSIGGWYFTPGTLIGNAGISGAAPNADWAALRGGFVEPVTPEVGEFLQVIGKVQLVGGGFESSGSFRMGMFYSDSAGRVDTTFGGRDSTRWTGIEDHHSGYLIIPQSGSNGTVDWNGTPGTWGGVIDGLWRGTSGTTYVVGSHLPVPGATTDGAGTYDFAMSVGPKSDGSNDVRWILKKAGYYAEGSLIDSHSPSAAKKFNAVLLGLNTNASTTAMNLIDVEVKLGTTPIATDVDESPSSLPTVYALDQNYPNPFNPSTTIEFALPMSSQIRLVVYDLLGRIVANVVEGDFKAGFHKVEFNASHLSSGIYFYRLEAGDFVAVKKLMLLK